MNAHTPPALALSDVIVRTVPRYTSYPTAPHFSGEVTSELYGEWLEEAGRAGGSVSLYLHIPYCRSICHYCGCTTKATRKDAPIRSYVEVLRREIALVADRLGPVDVSHIHWGGGTPNLVPPDLFETVIDDLHRRFTILDTAEHAIELDPRHVDKAGARFLADMGVTRVSLGVQDLDPDVQAAIGRIQPLETVEAAVAALRIAGIGAINMDLIYGLPLQTPASVRRTALHAAGLAPSRISLFGYAHVPWFRAHQRRIDEATLPPSDQRLELARISRETIDAFGYDEIGIDHFARPEDTLTLARDAGTLKRNFQGYTTDSAETLIGLGSSSIGRTPRGFVQNTAANGIWQRAIDAGAFPVERGKIFTGEDVVRGAVIEALLCLFEADLPTIAAAHGHAPGIFDGALATLEPLVRSGWVTSKSGRVRIETHKTELARVVASAFDAYLGGGGRHSVAV
jgi:oxygen-independent coproporphyrinogen-3 oxidase